MIVQGFPGIGKSSLPKGKQFIDLDSSIFFVDGKKSDDWYKLYVNIADHLSKRGYIVLMSSHDVVTNELRSRNLDFKIIAPSPELEGQWIARLQQRYDSTKLDKDMRALETMKKIFKSATESAAKQSETISICGMDYCLADILDLLANDSDA